jgi:hypothetical protein
MGLMPPELHSAPWDVKTNFVLEVLLSWEDGNELTANMQVYRAKLAILRFLRESIACQDKETPNTEFATKTTFIESVCHFFQYILSDQTGVGIYDKRVKLMVNEILGMLITISADDDPNLL